MATIETPQAVAEIYRRRPDVRVMLYERNTPAIVGAVQMQQFDLGIVGRQPPYEGVDTLFQTAFPYVCLLPEDHPAADECGLVDLAGLARTETFVTFGEAYPDEMPGIEKSLSQLMREGSRLSAANMPITACLVRETGALAVVDPFSAELAVRLGGVVFGPTVERLLYHVAVITRGRETLSREAVELAEIFVARLSERAAQTRAMAGWEPGPAPGDAPLAGV